MKTLNSKRILTGIALISALSLLRFSLCSAQSSGDNRVRIHIEKEVNGQSEIFDTAFTAPEDPVPSALSLIPPGYIPFAFPNPVPNPDPIDIPRDTIIYRPHDSKGMIIELNDGTLPHGHQEEMKARSEDFKELQLKLQEMPELKDFDILQELNADNIEKEMTFVMTIDREPLLSEGDNIENITSPENNPQKGTKGIIIYRNYTYRDFKYPVNPLETPELSSGLTSAEIRVFPNPSNGNFTLNIEVPQKGNLKVTIMDINGREIAREELGNFSGNYTNAFDLSDQAKGIYVLKIEQGKSVVTKKIAIN